MSDSSQNNDTKERLHLVDYIDTDAVDFEPMTKSMNGAAITPNVPSYSKKSRSSKSTKKESSSSHQKRQEYLYHRAQSMEDDDGDLELHYLNGGNDDKNNGYNKRSSSKYQKSNWSFVDILLCCVPQRLKLYLKTISLSHSFTSSHLSLVSSLSICTIFFAIVVLSTFISSSLNKVADSDKNDRFNAMGSKMMRPSRSKISYQGDGLAPPVGTRLPPALEGVFANVDDLPVELMDTPIYWHGK